MLKLHKMQNNHLVGFFLKRGVKINLRNAYLKQHDSNSITGTGLSGTNEMASSPLYFIALHHLLWRASVVKQGGVASHQADRQPLEETETCKITVLLFLQLELDYVSAFLPPAPIWSRGG